MDVVLNFHQGHEGHCGDSAVEEPEESTMRLFIDSGNIKDIGTPIALGIIDGVTT